MCFTTLQPKFDFKYRNVVFKILGSVELVSARDIQVGAGNKTSPACKTADLIVLPLSSQPTQQPWWIVATSSSADKAKGRVRTACSQLVDKLSTAC